MLLKGISSKDALTKFGHSNDKAIISLKQRKNNCMLQLLPLQDCH